MEKWEERQFVFMTEKSFFVVRPTEKKSEKGLRKEE
jgi:hypothetical protein|tara:strand:+ start:1268 stop:1375 length:108 start_codon:yes stop_codon:yes gene_type:complete